jgi:hypothetical protein
MHGEQNVTTSCDVTVLALLCRFKNFYTVVVETTASVV